MEKIDTINDSLRRLFGLDSNTGKSMYRVVWANNQYEKRLTKFTDSGIELLHEEVRELPKYPWLKDLYVLEHLVVIPEVNKRELPTQKLSYEPLWSFIGSDGNPVPPTVQGCKFIIDTVLAATGKESLAGKYSKSSDDPNAPITSEAELAEHQQAKMTQLQTELFGDQSGLKQAIVSGEGIAVPSNYEKGVH